jgi:PAS domain S-box-containing protein
MGGPVDIRSASQDADALLLATDLHVEATNRLVEALVESENRMRRRLDLLADAVIETDAGGAFVFLNPAWLTLTGHCPEECIGRPAGDFFPREERDVVMGVLAGGTDAPREIATHLVRTDGQRRYVVLTASPFPSGGGVAVLRDVTREYEYQEELRRLSVVASATSNLVVITDDEGRIDWVNPAFEARTGYTLAEVRGLKPGAFLQGPDTDPEAAARLGAAVHEQRATSEELLNYSRSGEPYWVAVYLTPVHDASGRLERFISVQADITERRRVERMKTEFVSTVSHELRTPLTVISGALGLLSAGVAGPLPQQASDLLEIAEKNSGRLTSLINDLLDMERLSEGGLRIERTTQPLLPIVERALRDHAPYADRFDVRLALAQGCDTATVAVDSQRLDQVLSNLLSNACKFAPPGSTVDVGVHCTGSAVRISVTDEGPGIPESFRDAVFEKFSQADGSSTRSTGGTGLGLAIAKELVERMDGSIGFDSAEGRGTTFFVDLPVAEPRVRDVLSREPATS